jgi:NAD(P)-dependent dehydrogenase (short-subunit alcohol dehydrogenase family)
MRISLKGKIALVTGASRGIGKEISETLAINGATVVLVGRDENTLSEIVKKLRLLGGSAEFLVCDISEISNVASLVNKCLQNNLIPNILVNNLGGVNKSQSWDSYVSFESVFRLNFLTAYELTRQLLPFFLEMESARIINIGSVSARNGLNGIPYAVSKSALETFTLFAARDIARKNPGVVMSMVAPGPISVDGKYLASLERNDPEKLGVWLDKNNVSAGRLGKVQEVANLVLFLASEHAAFLHGAVIPIDGATF